MNIALPLKKWHSSVVAALLIGTVFSALNYRGHEYSFRWNILALFILLVITSTNLFTRYSRLTPLSTHYPWLSYGLLMLWSLASLLWSAVPSDSLLFWATQLSGLFALYIGYQLTAKQWQYFKLFLIPLALTVACYTLYQSEILKISRPAGFLLNWNSNAAFIALLILPFCASFLTLKQTFIRHALGLVLLVCTMGMAVTESRGGLMVLVLGLLPIAWSQHETTQQRWRIVQLCFYLISGYVAAELLQNGALIQRLTSQAGSANIDSDTLKTLGSGRHALWLAAWHMYLDRPILGWGLGMFHWLYPQYRNPLLLERGQLAHNDYLDTLLGLGPVGLILLLLFVFSVARLFWQAFKKNNTEHLALASASLAILAHSFFSFNLFQSALIIVLGLYVGYLSQLSQDESIASQQTEQVNKSLHQTLTGVLTVSFSAWLLVLYMGFYQAELAIREPSPDKKIQHLSKAQQWLPYMALYDSLMADTVMNLLKQRKPEDLRPEELQAMLDFAMDKVNQLEVKNPLDSSLYRHRGDLLLYQAKTPEQTQQAIDNYLLALTYNPYDLNTRYQLVEILERQEREPEAYRLLFEGLDKAYFASPKAGLQLLGKIKQVLSTTRVTEEQSNALEKQIKVLLNRLMTHQADNFVLRDIGIPLQ